MATGDKNIQKVLEPEKAALLRKIFCIVLAVFGAFVIFFGVMSVLNAESIVTDAAAAATAKGETFSMSATFLIVMSVWLALGGLLKLFLGIDSIAGKFQKVLNIVIIINLIMVIVAFVTIYNVNGQFMAVLIVDLILSIIAVCWLNVRLARYLREMAGELKKLTWLSGRDLASHTVAVIVFVVLMAVLIWLLDLAFSSGFSAIATIKIG